MHTDDLITLLARSAGPAPRAVVLKRLLPGALAALALAALLAAVTLGWVPMSLYDEAAPWFKLAYGSALALAAAWLVARLARPVPRMAGPAAATAAVLLLALGVGLWDWARTAAAERGPALMGHSAVECPWNVLLLALPALAAALWALRGLAPTRPVAAGAAAGLMAGAVGALAYALACTELALAFVAAWYTLGMLMTAGLGAWLGPRVLRW